MILETLRFLSHYSVHKLKKTECFQNQIRPYAAEFNIAVSFNIIYIYLGRIIRNFWTAIFQLQGNSAILFRTK